MTDIHPTAAPDIPDPATRNMRVAIYCAIFVCAMLGIAFAAVPLYDLFCRVTGLGGTTQVATENPLGVIDRQMTTRFDANVRAGLPWTVRPAARVTDPVGTVQTVSYIATNTSDRPVTGTASFNVVPEDAGVFFNKIECFCFTEQTLEPGESVEMPVTFFLDPRLDDSRDMATVREVTLSYTFYPVENGEY